MTATPASAPAGMGRIVTRRLVLIPVTLLLVAVLIFVVTAVIPGDVARRILGREADPASVALVRQQLGLDRPLVVQFGDWLGGFVVGDWGDSYQLRAPVRPVVLDHLGRSALLAGVALVLMVPVSLAVGVVAALRRDTRLDRVLSVGSMALASIPDFVTGVVLLVVFAVQLGWFPATARALEGEGLATQLHRLVLPAATLVLVYAGYIARLTRASTVEVLDAPYVRTARLKGLPRRRVLTRHVLRNSLVPAVTVIGVQSGYMLAGLVAIERLFGYPGLGNLLLEAAVAKDLPMLQAVALVSGALFMLCVLVTDLVHLALDPRLREGAR